MPATAIQVLAIASPGRPPTAAPAARIAVPTTTPGTPRTAGSTRRRYRSTTGRRHPPHPGVPDPAQTRRVSPLPTGRRIPCTGDDARARFHDAEAFLGTAHAATDPDVVATNAVHSAIAAADAICCRALRARSSDRNLAAPVKLLAKVDRKLAATLSRVLDRKTQAAYETRDIVASDAAACVRHATLLVTAAQSRILAS